MSECCMTRSESDINGLIWKVAELIEQAHKNGYKAGYSKAENDYHAKTEEDRQSSYELGLNMAWEAAGKLMLIGCKEVNNVLSDGTFSLTRMDEIFSKYTASEAIEKIREYEEKKKQEEDNEIHVWDEAQSLGKFIGIVTHISEIEGFSILWKDGSVGKRKDISDFKKTGRHFPEITEVLKKLKEGDE